MLNSSKVFYKSWSFWLLFFTFLIALVFIIYGKLLAFEVTQYYEKRVLYGGIFFISILIMDLLYLLFTKEENRRRRKEYYIAYIKEKKDNFKKYKEKKELKNKLKYKFNHAKKLLKESSLYRQRPYDNYEIPWYLVMGEEESKKSSILKYSGLDFPVNINYITEDEDDKSSFEWFFTEDSIFVNVPSIFVSIENSRQDIIVWDEFLRLFKKERWQRPVNGIILTLRVEKFQNNQDDLLKEYAKVLRKRLDELSKTFFSDIPVYVIFSGLETLTGFREFFHTLTNEEKKEILGVTFEENLLNINSDTIALNFSKLQYKLEGDRLDKLHREINIDSRTKAYFFNDEFRELLHKITIFSSQVFSKTRYHAPLMLRGIYFTSIDTIASKNIVNIKNTTSLYNEIPKGIFLPKVFERIILSESNLVKISDKFKRKYLLYQTILSSILFLLIIGSTLYWSIFVSEESTENRKIAYTINNYNKIEKMLASAPVLKKVKIRNIGKKYFFKIGQLGGNKGSGSVNFLLNKFELTPFSKAELLIIGQKIKALDRNNSIKIFGYTDSIGSKEDNFKLSLNRANKVKNFFISQDIDSKRLFAYGLGDKNPLMSNNTEVGRGINRRVEIFAYTSKEGKKNTNYTEKYIIEVRSKEWKNVLITLETLWNIDSQDKNSSSITKFLKPGFYRVTERKQWITKLYHKTLNTVLLNRVTYLIEKELLNNLENNIKTIETLTAYLLLNNKEQREKNPDYLKQYMLNRWGNLDEDQVKNLNKHFEILLSIELNNSQLNKMTIKRARNSILRNSGESGFFYEILKEVTSHMNLHNFQFNQVLASNIQSIIGGEYKIPGIYTTYGYENVIFKSSQKILKDAIEKNWILGKNDGYTDSEFKYLHKQVLNLYFADYHKLWSKAISKISIPKYNNIKDLTEQLALFSSPASPIVDILRGLKENTFLYTLQEKAKIARDKDKTGISAKLNKIGNIVNSVEDPHKQYKLDLRANFNEYHQLLNKHFLPSVDLITFQKRMKKVYQQMLIVQSSTEKDKVAYEIVNKNSSSTHSSFEIKHSFIPFAISSWYNTILKQNWKQLTTMVEGHVNQKFIDEIWETYALKINNKFPLNPHSMVDIDIEEFDLFFKKDGLLDEFYKKYLFPFVSIDYINKTYTKKIIDNNSITINPELVESMFYAKEIQKLFFDQKDNSLKISFILKPSKLSNNLATMDFQYEKQLLIYEHGPKYDKTFIFPAESKKSLAKFTLYDFNLKRVVKIRGNGEWALLRLLYKLYPTVIYTLENEIEIKLSYMDQKNHAILNLTGRSANIFAPNSPLRKFTLDGL